MVDLRGPRKVLLVSTGGAATLLLALLLVLPAQTHGYLEDREPVYLEAKVGSYVILNCPVDFPKNDPIPYVLHWNKDLTRRKPG